MEAQRCAGDGVDQPVGFGRKSPVSLFAKTVHAMHVVLLREMPASADEKTNSTVVGYQAVYKLISGNVLAVAGSPEEARTVQLAVSVGRISPLLRK